MIGSMVRSIFQSALRACDNLSEMRKEIRWRRPSQGAQKAKEAVGLGLSNFRNRRQIDGRQRGEVRRSTCPSIAPGASIADSLWVVNIGSL